MNTTPHKAINGPRHIQLHTKDLQGIADEIREGRGVVTPLAIATRWGIDHSLATTLIKKHLY